MREVSLKLVKAPTVHGANRVREGLTSYLVLFFYVKTKLNNIVGLHLVVTADGVDFAGLFCCQFGTG